MKNYRHGKRKPRDMRWINWYINRGRLPLNPTKKQLRAVSWRRVK